MKITVVGAGYVGMSLAVLLAQKHEVTVYDIDADKVNKINKGISPIKDNLAELLFAQGVKITATSFIEDAYKDAEVIFICVPTDFNGQCLDTTVVNNVVDQIRNYNTDAIICIKSTVPIGYTESLHDEKIVFSPEFLREGQAVYDNQYPSRIIASGCGENARRIIKLLSEITLNNTDILYCRHTGEAEAIKLFSNSYLAMRVSFFNELDSFCLVNNLDTKTVIDGVCLDPRIGKHYNNPSFGYGGYCLPKDTKQLLYQYKDTPESIFSAIVESNEKRKQFIVDKILDMNIGCVGIYRLNMKKGSDNCRESALWDIAKRLDSEGVGCVLYEPGENIGTLDEIKKCPIILANRMHADLEDVKDRVFTRDIFGIN